MARTLNSKVCVVCGGSITPINEFSDIPDEIVDLDESLSMMAHVKCSICGTRYIGWYIGGNGNVVDLSYESTMSDQPGDGDVPNQVTVSRGENIISRLEKAADGTLTILVQSVKVITLKPRLRPDMQAISHWIRQLFYDRWWFENDLSKTRTPPVEIKQITQGSDDNAGRPRFKVYFSGYQITCTINGTLFQPNSIVISGLTEHPETWYLRLDGHFYETR